MGTYFFKDREEGFRVTFRRNRRSKCMRITVSSDGNVLVTRPIYVSEERASSFLNEQIDWVRKKLTNRKGNVDPDLAIHSPEHYLEHKERARKLVEEKIGYWNRFYGFGFNRISIRNQKSRWGSCSSGKNLSFNYKIVFLKEELQDYLIIHELCHLKHMNHSREFWYLVAKASPEYKAYSKALKRAGGVV